MSHESGNVVSDSKGVQTQLSDNKMTVEESKRAVPTCGCMTTPCSCSNLGKSYIYALGRIEYRWPNESVEREVQQVVA
jgi:hypothetical protein